MRAGENRVAFPGSRNGGTATRAKPDSKIQKSLRGFGVGAAAFLLGVYGIYIAFDPFGNSIDGYFDNAIPDALIAMVAVACFVRAFSTRGERAAWLVIGAAMLSSAIAEVYWNAIIAHQADPPYPSVADLFYLAFYPLMFVGLTMLALRHVGKIRVSLWLHSLIAVLTVSAIDATLVFDAVKGSASGDGWEQATNLAYPLADIFLLVAVVGVWALSDWRPNATWRWIGGGMLVYTIGDAVFAYQMAADTYVVGGLVDFTWPLAAMMLFVAVTRLGETAAVRHSGSSPWLFLPTGLFALISIGILVWDHFIRIGTLALLLVTAASLAVVAQMGLAFLENLRLVASSERDASIDLVTEIPNRRRLMVDLKRAGKHATESEPMLLALFDLDGFKDVNDALGHSVGDEMLRRFASRLTEIAAPSGVAYRLGGDEFCLILQGDLRDAKLTLENAAAALIEHGEGFEVANSFGYATMPADTRDPDEALHIADRRMYEIKPFRVRSARRSSRIGEPPEANPTTRVHGA